METKKAVTICCACVAVAAAGFFGYRYVSEQEAIKKYNEEHQTLVQKDANYAKLFEMLGNTKCLKDVLNSPEFNAVFSEAYPSHSVQARYMAIPDLQCAPITPYTIIGTKVDYYGNKSNDTIYHYKGDLHTADNLTKLSFDFDNYGFKAEINIANSYITSELNIPDNAVFTNNQWKLDVNNNHDYYQVLEDYTSAGNQGEISIHISRAGAYLALDPQGMLEALDKNTTVIIKDDQNLPHPLAGYVKDKLSYYVTDIETLTNCLFSNTDEVVITITTGKGNKAVTFTKKITRPNIWAAYLLSAELNPAEVYEEICAGKDFKMVVMEASMKLVSINLPNLINK
ncbi:MAG: hypothetical protein J6Y99_04005 [Bacteroidales bacterium]|nr:hypothetical protein [Bacteroidales bacterium]